MSTSFQSTLVITLRCMIILFNLCFFPDYCVLLIGIIAVGISKLFIAVQFIIDKCLIICKTCKSMCKRSSMVETNGDDHYGFTEEEWAEMELQMKEHEEREEAEKMADID